MLVSIRLPEGMLPESLPAPASAESEEFDFHAEWRFDAGVLTYERRAALKVLEVSGERYADFRKLARSLSKADRRAIVIVPE